MARSFAVSSRRKRQFSNRRSTGRHGNARCSVRGVSMAFCTKCGAQIATEAVFCGNCGNSVMKVAVQDLTASESPVNPQTPSSPKPARSVPRITKSYWYITVPITLILLVIWHSRTSIVARGTHQSAPTASRFPLESDASARVAKIYDGTFSKCGDKYYAWDGLNGYWAGNSQTRRSRIIEFSGKPVLAAQESLLEAHPGVDPAYLYENRVSATDRLNGLTWVGSWAVSISSVRVLGPNGASNWQQGYPYYLGLKQLNGVWLVTQPRFADTETTQDEPVDTFSDNVPCEKVSAYLSLDGATGATPQ
jgi:hypothetical protein